MTDFYFIPNMENPNIDPLFWNSFFQEPSDIQYIRNYNDYYEKWLSAINQILQIKLYITITLSSNVMSLTMH